ncbi:GtrA family protein [Actinocrinis puniceicyclus]|uniref:GtrA family protein n=1 Tax=Actinocrinis puniceicyclus TaxID=977794 RepID=A0A8J7WSW9_9ACTN|nr:GtrA family protein [Actinocrinis puniceicyclus]MBS2965417.1 GtrA family protein [Actinocrinis puniceicyclus]
MSILKTVAASRRWGTFLRYAAGSLVATACSEIVLVAGYGLLGLGPQAAALVAWVAGAVPNYLLNRRWAWSGRDRAPAWRELLPYWVITLGTAALAIAATTAADGMVRHAVSDRGERSFLLGVVYLAAYGFVFVIKFVLFDGWVFSARRSSPATATAEGG